MTRLPVVSRSMVPERFRDAFDELTASSGGTIPDGPGSIAINSPEMARRRSYLSNYLRFETSIPERIQELAILITARCMDCQYVWNAHASAARRAGVSDAVVDSLRDNLPLPPMSAEESAIINYGMELFRTHQVTPRTFQGALDQFGPQYLVELTTLMGHYVQNAFFLNAFTVELPSQRSEPILPV